MSGSLYNPQPINDKRALCPTPRAQSLPDTGPHGSSPAGSPGSWASVCGPELPGPSCAQVMPCLEAVALILLIVLVPDPPRGAAEKQEEAVGTPRSSWCEDVRYLGRK